MNIYFRDWLQEKFTGLVGVRRCTTGSPTGSIKKVYPVDLHVALWTGNAFNTYFVTDPLKTRTIKSIIQHLKDRGIGVLLSDHNVRETLDICEKAYIVNEGQIIAEGDAELILSNQKVREVYLGHQFRL